MDTALYTGKTIAYKLPFAGSGDASLTLTLADGTETAAVPVYMNNTRVTTHYPQYTVIKMTYDGSAWRTDNYYSNSNNYDRRLHNSAIKAAAASFRENPSFDTVQALQDIGTGEALVSFLDETGRPSMVERARVLFPGCRMAAADPGIVTRVIANEYDLMGKYEETIDRESAYERIEQARAEAAAAAEEAARAAQEAKEAEAARIKAEKEAEAARIKAEKEEERLRLKAEKEADRLRLKEEKEQDRLRLKAEKEAERAEAEAKRKRDRVTGNIVNSVVGTIGREAGRQIIRGIFGTRK